MRPSAILTALLIAAPLAPAATVQIDYGLDTGSATIDPFELTDPNTGTVLTIAPVLTIESGGFAAAFTSDAAGIVGDGAAAVTGFAFAGALDIEIASTIEVFGFPVAVTANLTGPLVGMQVSDSLGDLSGLSIYLETTVGNYDTTAGPLDCTDSALGLFCAAIESALGVVFPLEAIATEDSPLPFTGGTFSGINSTPSTAGNSIDFSVPIDADNSFGVEIDFTWTETERTFVIPEPSAVLLLLTTAGIALLRRRENS